MHKPLRISQAHKQNDPKFSDNDEKSSKVSNKRKCTRKIIKAGSLVRKNPNPYKQGRNIQTNLENDFSNSFIEGKSYINGNSKHKGNVVEKP